MSAAPERPHRTPVDPDAAFDGIFRAHAARAVALATHACGDRSVAEEIVQEVFLALHRVALVEVVDNPGGWITRAVVRRCLNERRRRGRERGALGRVRVEAGSTDALGFLDRPALVSALRSLTVHQRLVLLLVDGEDMSVVDAAAVVGCAPSTARVHLARARSRARSALEAGTTPSPHLASEEPS